MKKIILITILQLSLLMAGSFVMTQGNPLVKTGTNIPTDSDWTPKPLPTEKFNVLDYGLKGDGVTDDSAALKTLAKNINITNWYFPEGKTFLLYGITPPKHVKFIWGPGTLKRKITGEKWQLGIFEIIHTAVYDGLNIINGTGNWQGSESMGQFIVGQNNPANPEFSSDGIEIRNCTFDGSGIFSDSISLFNGKTFNVNKHANLKIYGNTFNNPGHFAIEGGDRTEPRREDMNGFPNLEIFDNDFTSDNYDGMGISIVRQRSLSNTKIYNNRMNKIKWGIELPLCDGVEVYGNRIENANGHSFIEGIPWGNIVLSAGTNLVHDNWFGDRDGASTQTYGSYINIYAGSKTKFYNNYIRGTVKITTTGDHVTQKGGEWYNNTFVKNSRNGFANIFQIDNDVTTVSVHDNVIYATDSHTGIAMNASNPTFYDNEIHVASGGTCIDKASQSGGSCDTSYTGTPPTEK